MFTKRYEKIDLLLLPEDFVECNLPYPNSLLWVDSFKRSE